MWAWIKKRPFTVCFAILLLGLPIYAPLGALWIANSESFGAAQKFAIEQFRTSFPEIEVQPPTCSSAKGNFLSQEARYEFCFARPNSKVNFLDVAVSKKNDAWFLESIDDVTSISAFKTLSESKCPSLTLTYVFGFALSLSYLMILLRTYSQKFRALPFSVFYPYIIFILPLIVGLQLDDPIRALAVSIVMPLCVAFFHFFVWYESKWDWPILTTRR